MSPCQASADGCCTWQIFSTLHTASGLNQVLLTNQRQMSSGTAKPPE